jgi:hypothetical protein
MPSKSVRIIVAAVALATLAHQATAQQLAANMGAAALPCFKDDAIVDGQRRPPTPAEVTARESSPSCSAEADPHEVDHSAKAARKLDKIYDNLEKQMQDMDDGTDPGSGGD